MRGCSSTARPTHMHILLTFTPSCVSDVFMSLHLCSSHHHEFSSLTKSISVLPPINIQIRSGNFLSLCSFLCHLRCGLSVLCVRLIRHLWLAPSSSSPVPTPELRKPSMCPDSAPSLWDVLRNEPQKEAVKWNSATGVRP